MNKDKNEFKASNVETAIEEGLKELNIEKEEAEIEIISKGGFFKKAVVRIEKKKSEEIGEEEKEEKSQGKIFIEEVLKLMNLECRVEEKIKNKELSFYIKGEEVSKIIGYRGETLDALQHLVSNKINKEEKLYERIIVDADFYRQKREITLTNLAKRLAKKAAMTGEDVELEPMTAFERRVIHSALQESKMASTKSEGEGRERHIIISPLENRKDAVQYGASDFKKTGPKKTKSFGYNKKRF